MLGDSSKYPASWGSNSLYSKGVHAKPSSECYVGAYLLEEEDCCMIWNWGFACSHLCSQWHCCSNELCRSIFDDNHRAIQHGPRSRCYGHDVRLLGMNILDPTPLSFPETSSVEDTQNGCRRYKVRPPSLNASLFRDLLKGTALNPYLQASLVRGWKEGFMLGSHLPPSNHFVPEALNRPLEQTDCCGKV